MNGFTRRGALVGGALLPFVAGCATAMTPNADFAALEAKAGGRLGVFVLDTGSGAATGHRAGERFGMCSTFKLPLAAAILNEADRGRLPLDRRISFTQADMVPYAPVTSQHLAEGAMTIEALAEAAQVTSDNVAANLLLRQIGGPEGFTAKLRALGDSVTRLDRFEPTMNLVPAGEVRDTTTPEAMAHFVAKALTGDVLSATSREKLAGWMVATTTGQKRIRAGLPADWRAGDKTGTASADGMVNKQNDVAVAWPPGRAPIVVAAFYESPGAFENIRDEDQAVLAEVGRIVTRWVAAPFR